MVTGLAALSLGFQCECNVISCLEIYGSSSFPSLLRLAKTQIARSTRG